MRSGKKKILGTLEFTTGAAVSKISTDKSFSGDSDSNLLTEKATKYYIDKTNQYYCLGRPRVLDLTGTDADLVGFEGGFTDGQYGYTVPNRNAAGGRQGKVARFNLNDFSTVSVLNLASVDADLVGFHGGFTDGRYGYFVPFCTAATQIGKVARVDLANFAVGGVTVLNLQTVDSDLEGFLSGFTDGRYGYFVPFCNDSDGHFGKVARVDLDNFAVGGVTVLDLTSVDSHLKGFYGGFTDGRYGYFVPNYSGDPNNDSAGRLVRVDLDNFAVGGVTVLNLASVDSTLIGFRGGFIAGTYAYLCPDYNGAVHGKVVRIDLNNFTTTGVSSLNLASVNADLKGFYGGFTDGKYGYFVPFNNGSYFGKIARVDFGDFTTSGVKYYDLSSIDANLKGFVSGFTDGRFGYLIPYNNGSSYFGKVVRLQMFLGSTF